MTSTYGENRLILAPLSPSGLDAYLTRVSASCPSDPDLVAISYTQPPREWASAWRSHVGPLPARSIFIEGRSTDDDEAYGFSEVVSADPTDPMSVVVPVEKQLAEWQSTGNDTVLSLQTLSILLQYSDTDTVFRYLNLLTHKVRAVGARGYFQIDPELHDEKTIDTMKVLFDTVERVGEEELSDRRDAQTTAAGGEESPVDHLLSLYESSKSRLSEALNQPNSDAATNGDADGQTGEPAADATGTDDVVATGEELLTDSERIRRLLLQSGGQMRQTALVSALPWSSSTVSRKLTEMEERDEITRVQVGRGKVVFHPGNEPEATKSSLGSRRDQPQIFE